MRTPNENEPVTRETRGLESISFFISTAAHTAKLCAYRAFAKKKPVMCFDALARIRTLTNILLTVMQTSTNLALAFSGR